MLGIAPGVVATENDGRSQQQIEGPVSGGGERSDNARFVLALAKRGIRSVLLRLPPATHGDSGFIAAFVKFARQKQAPAYIGDESNRWSAVHRDDAAQLVRLALESLPAGTVLHAVGEEGVRIRDVAGAIASGLGVEAVSVSQAEANAYVG